jgi:ribosomal protein L37AE/L43A
MITMGKRCWNCGRTITPLRSVRTGIEYCAACGAATDGVGWINAMNEVFGVMRTALRDDKVKNPRDGDLPNREQKKQ